jgi:tetratricopeptide (TPR) repeat protein
LTKFQKGLTMRKIIFLIFIAFLFNGCAGLLKTKPPKPNPETFFNDGVEYTAKGEYELALQSFYKALQYAEEDTLFQSEIYNLIGIVYHKDNKLDQALDAFRQATILDSRYDQAWNNLGYIYFLQGRNRLALENFAHALELNPDYEQARQNYETVKKLVGGDLDIGAFQLFQSADKIENLEEQMENYRKAIAKDSAFAEAYNNLAVAQYYYGMSDSAIINLKKALKINPYYAEALNNLAFIFDDKGEHALAIKLYLQAVYIKDNYILAFNNLAEAYYRMKDYESTEKILRKILLVDPQNKYARKKLRDLGDEVKR